MIHPNQDDKMINTENKIECKAERDSPHGKCIGTTFSVYQDKETGEIAIVCHWGHVTYLNHGSKPEVNG